MLTARDSMTADVEAVTPDGGIDHVLDLLADRDRDVGRLPVVEDGRVVGIIAGEDRLRALRDERVENGE
ncbi:CBS domain-containing protein [Halorientalis sp.]|jgi:CBS domain-containing protein|uniref:CBS domain-containing protein n=1 Tax=Halorientalis sp. TaxID=1931229 RepID=UPI0026024B86|nr:CBS domain-containing protein [Halorientalis sp.]